jgi:2-polyprenyl-3-methyl-5-hydroxy-6-metoxy-1,4-benzoquinol methylase
MEGCDISPEAVRLAEREAVVAGVPVRFFVLDALNEAIPAGYDVVTCSLFLHHLDEAGAVALLRKMAAAAGQLLLVDDLERSGMGYVLTWFGTRLFSRSPVVRHDGPVSAAAAFRLAEVRDLASCAGLERARLARHWPRRFLLSWRRDDRVEEPASSSKVDVAHGRS